MTGRTVGRSLLAVLVLLVTVAATGLALRDGPTGDEATSTDSQAPAAAPAPPAPRLRGRVLGTIGVASFNALRHLGLRAARADWDRLTGDPAVDLIGWQESKSPAFRTLAPRYRSRGWDTWFWPDPDGPISVAVSWRRQTFALIRVRFWRMHRGGFLRETTDPFPARWVVAATLRHRSGGQVVTLLNTHVNQHIETGDRFQRNLNASFARRHLSRLAALWRETPGDVLVGTGDYNFDHVDDSRARPAGGISRTFEGVAVSSYDALGLEGLLPTRNTRWIDYVFLADRSVRGPRRHDPGTAQFVRHRVLTGFHSDHRPLLARIRLYAAGS